jgi:hypothetical protein
MNEEEKLSWSAPEYEEQERSPDWFWALAVIMITASLASIIYSNYFFAVLIILSGSLLWFYSKKSPEMVEYELNTRGFKVKSHLYPYENIKSFFVQIHNTPTLFLKTERFYMPILSIPIEYDLADDIYSIFISKNVPEEEMKEHPSEKIIKSLGL